jgi:HK97 family phage portal protein
MGWISRLFERRSLAYPSPELLALFNAGQTQAGEAVSPERAMALPVVAACIAVLSQDIAKTDLKLRRKLGASSWEDDADHPLSEIVGSLPNAEVDAFTFKRNMTASMLQYGVAYAQIIRTDGRVQALWQLPSSAVRVDRNEQRVKRWTLASGGTVTSWLFDADQPPILEVTFDSPIARAREAIGVGLALQKYVGRFFSNGARPQGVLTSANPLGDQARSSLRESWKAAFGGAGNSHGTAILDNGLDYKAIASANDHAQLNELLQTLRNEIAGCFRVPPHKISDLSRANYSNVEALSLEYLNGALDPLFTAWEMALRRDVLSARQYGRYTLQFDRQALVRSDTQSLHASLAVGVNAGFLSINDARQRLGLNPIGPEGDRHMFNTALAPLAQAGSDANDAKVAA